MWSWIMKLYYFLKLTLYLLFVVKIILVAVNFLSFLCFLPNVVYFLILFNFAVLEFSQQMAEIYKHNIPIIRYFIFIPLLLSSLHRSWLCLFRERITLLIPFHFCYFLRHNVIIKDYMLQ